jgi:tetratricopeptide (TPR) repeat protein
LEKALAEQYIAETERARIVEQYRAARKTLFDYVRARKNWHFRRVKGSGVDRKSEPQFNPPTLPDGLPGEFADYFRGAVLYHRGQREKAIQTWLGLLDRPVHERAYRSTWAAFMIGKTLLAGEPNAAIEWLQFVRQLAEEGFVDSLGLASSSLGWEARVALDLEQYDQAIELYVAQMATGDPTAITSLQLAACWALGKENPSILAQVAENPTARKVVTAYVISRGGPFHRGPAPKLASKWLEAVEAAHIDVVQDADRLAWAAYQIGEMELAKRWLDVAPQDTAIARWIRAKLLLRDGKIPEAAEQLAHIADRFPPAQQPRYGYHRTEPIEVQVRGELGVLHLARRQYVEALSVLLEGGYWEDAAYVAERVLTPDELKDYVDRMWPSQESAGDTNASTDITNETNPAWICNRVRYLLARRLTGMGCWKEARPYYPSKWQVRLDAYIRALQDGYNEWLPSQQRAAALWKAACIARYEGMELLGTEVEPDWSVYNGRFERESFSQIRSVAGPNELVGSTVDEQWRIEQHLTDPEKRFHYRYAAAELAWQAAEFMPDESDQTARVLCIAGCWLKDRDPQAADRFYKTMVRRCGKTKLGKEADQLRWFPKIDIDKKELLR